MSAKTVKNNWTRETANLDPRPSLKQWARKQPEFVLVNGTEEVSDAATWLMNKKMGGTPEMLLQAKNAKKKRYDLGSIRKMNKKNKKSKPVKAKKVVEEDYDD